MKNEKEKKHNKKLIVLFIFLFMFVGVSSIYLGMTYAKYTSTFTPTGGISVAKWAFADDNDQASLTINLDQTVDTSTLVANRIAPGTSGSFSVHLSNQHSEVGVNFEVSLVTTGKPTYLVFYKDAQHQNAAISITGSLTGGDSTGLDVTFYWAWVYDTEPAGGHDTDDTSAGEAATLYSISVSVVGTQVQPGAAITSHIN